MAGDNQHIHNPAKAEEFARSLGLQVGGGGHPFVGAWSTKGLYAYRSGKYNGMAFFGTGGDERNRLEMPHESDRYRPWNRYDPNIPTQIQERLIALEDDDSTSIGQPIWTKPPAMSSPKHMSEGKIALKSVHGKFLSAQPDGRAEWNRDIASDWEYFHLERRKDGKITLRGTHGMYVSAQADGTVQINRQAAPPSGWEEFTVENRGNNVVCLRSCHGKYLSAQPDGTAQWNRGHAPRGGWEDIQFVQQGGTGQISDAASRIQKHINTGRSSASSSNEPIQILEAVPGKPVRFKLNNPPSHNEAWVGIYPKGASDQDHGAQNQRWKYIQDIDVNNASLTIGEWAEGDFNIRVFSDGGYTVVERKDFSIQSTHRTRSTGATTRIQEHTPVKQHEPIEILEAVTGKPVRFRLNNPPNHNDAWVGIYKPNASDQDHGAQNRRWKWLRDFDINNQTLPKQAAGPWSIRVFSDGGHTLHARKDFDVKPAAPVDPAVLESSRRSALIALFIGMVMLAPSIPLFIAGLGEGLSEAMTSASLEIEDRDEQGDLGWGIYIEGSLVDFNLNGIFDHCENIIVNATHSGSWMSDPWTGYQKVNPPDESRQVFEDVGCGSSDPVDQRHHDGRNLIKIGQACHGCMAGTTTITIQNQNGDALNMWIQNEENKETLGMLIPGAIFMGIGGFTFIVSLVILLKMGFNSNAPSSSKRRAVAAMGVGITLFTIGLPLLIIGSTSTGGDKMAMLAPGAVLFGIGALILFISATVVIRMGSTSMVRTEAEGNTPTRIEVLSFNHNQPIRFKINNPPLGNSAWVGVYPAHAGDRDHEDRWRWLRDLEVDNATLPGQAKGQWSIRLFSDGGYTLHERTDFEILEGYKDEVWMKNARIEDSRIKGDMIDHPTFGNMNRRTTPIIKRTKHGNMHRFETSNTTYLIKDEDLQDEVNTSEPFWGND